MNIQTSAEFSTISKEEKNGFAIMVAETIATDFNTTKNFTVIDLWNIQRRSKTTKKSRKSATFC